jgi:RND family efflux transporter MFP subunit
MMGTDSRLTLWWGGMVGVSLVGMSLAGCGGAPGNAAAPPGGGAPRAGLVRVGPVVRGTVTPATWAVGTVVARRTSVVASGADGKVEQFLVRRGQIVEAGQELSVLNMVSTDLEIAEAEALLHEREQQLLEAQTSRPEEIAEARARMEAAQVTRDIARDRLQRWERLSQGGAAPQDSLDDARERFLAAEKLLLAAKASYDLVLAGPRTEVRLQAQARRDAQGHHVDYLKSERDKRTTRAPFRGIVVAEHTEAGQWLSKGAPVVTLADLLEEVEVIANVDQRELRNVQLGGTVTALIDGVEPREWTGCVVAVIPRSDWERGARTFPVKVTIPNRVVTRDDLIQPVLREGMLARIQFTGPEHEATLVPKSALVRSETGTRLYAVIPGEQPGTGKARPVMVQEGGAYGDQVEVLGEDLQPGMLVVTEGAERLSPFADIVIQSDAPAAASGAPAPVGAGNRSPAPPQGGTPHEGDAARESLTGTSSTDAAPNTNTSTN